MDKTIYFKGLNGIRAIASLIVVIWHTDQFSYLFNLEKIGFHLNGMAGYAVDIFFVLSGFLISYLLMLEKEKTKTIDLKKFYIRRVLRIWPLYYLAILISLILIYFGVVPSLPSLIESIILYIFLLANLAITLSLTISTITPLWSVGVEEQFYLLWPLIVRSFNKLFSVFLSVFFLYLILKLIVYLVFTPNSVLYNFIATTRIDIMSLGALGAYLVYVNHGLLKIFFNKYVQIIAWIVLLVSIFYKPIHIYSFIDREINSIFYLIIILNISTNINSLISLENKVFNFLGKISYGVYVYHMIVIYIISHLIKGLGLTINYILIQILVTSITILISHFSYKYFETRFLSLKSRFTIINSTNQKP